MKRWPFAFLSLGLFLAGLSTVSGLWLLRTPPSTPGNPTSPSLTLNAEQYTTKQQRLTVVIPHHNLVQERRRSLLQSLSQNSQPETIILLSPNHFGVGSDDVLVNTKTWTTAQGNQSILPASDLAELLKQQGLATIDNTSFDQEHGIKNILPEISEFFPDAKLLPIMFKDSTSPEKIQLLLTSLENACATCGVIASVDMSHYQPAQVANIHDLQTLRALTTLDETTIWNTEVDSNASLAFLVGWAKRHQTLGFNLVDHTNSGILANNFDVETTSHIFGYYSTELQAQPEKQLTFTFGGDGMFGREIGYQFQDNFPELFNQLGNRTFWGTDISWINLEGPISDQHIIQDRQPEDLVFNFSKQTVEALRYLKLTTIGLGNNHTFNQGEAGLVTTQHMLNKAGVDFHGHPNHVSEETIIRYTQDNLQVALLSVNALVNTSGLTELIQKEKQTGSFVIVLPHWGSEYQPIHSNTQEQLATSWIEAGADLIIGSHPHVVQDAQLIQGKLVLYSLGNFVFDQTFSVETQQGLLVTGVLTEDTLQVVLVPIRSQVLKPQILQGPEKQQILEHVCQNVTCSNGVITVPL